MTKKNKFEQIEIEIKNIKIVLLKACDSFIEHKCKPVKLLTNFVMMRKRIRELVDE